MRDPATRTINIGYVVEEGPRVYIERINVRGNTRTRDHVIRREIDLGEGDAYNKVLLDRAERRLNSLGYFKRVRITNEPGTAPDRVVVNIDVEDQPTGSFSIAGGYSTADGVIGEVSVSESNFLGRGQFVRLAGTWGQRTQGVDFSFTEPYFLGYRMAAGFDLFSKYTDNTQLRPLREPRHRGPAASRTAGDRGVRLYAALFALPDRTQDPEHDQAAIQRLRDPDPGIHRPQSERHRHLSDLRHRRRDLGRAEGGRGQDPDLARRRDLRLQHARQRQEPEERHLRRAQARHRGPRRRLEVLPRGRRRPLLSRALRRRGRGGASPGRSYRRVRRQRPSGDGPLLPRSDLGPRLRIGRHRSARHLDRRCPRQRHRRLDLCRRLGRGPVPDLGPAARPRPKGRRCSPTPARCSATRARGSST